MPYIHAIAHVEAHRTTVRPASAVVIAAALAIAQLHALSHHVNERLRYKAMVDIHVPQ